MPLYFNFKFMIRSLVKIGFYLNIPLVIFMLLMKFRIIDQYLNTNYLFPVVCILFFTEVIFRASEYRK